MSRRPPPLPSPHPTPPFAEMADDDHISPSSTPPPLRRSFLSSSPSSPPPFPPSPLLASPPLLLDTVEYAQALAGSARHNPDLQSLQAANAKLRESLAKATSGWRSAITLSRALSSKVDSLDAESVESSKLIGDLRDMLAVERERAERVELEASRVIRSIEQERAGMERAREAMAQTTPASGARAERPQQRASPSYSVASQTGRGAPREREASPSHTVASQTGRGRAEREASPSHSVASQTGREAPREREAPLSPPPPASPDLPPPGAGSLPPAPAPLPPRVPRIVLLRAPDARAGGAARDRHQRADTRSVRAGAGRHRAGSEGRGGHDRGGGGRVGGGGGREEEEAG